MSRSEAAEDSIGRAVDKQLLRLKGRSKPNARLGLASFGEMSQFFHPEGITHGSTGGCLFSLSQGSRFIPSLRQRPLQSCQRLDVAFDLLLLLVTN